MAGPELFVITEFDWIMQSGDSKAFVATFVANVVWQHCDRESESVVSYIFSMNLSIFLFLLTLKLLKYRTTTSLCWAFARFLISKREKG